MILPHSLKNFLSCHLVKSDSCVLYHVEVKDVDPECFCMGMMLEELCHLSSTLFIMDATCKHACHAAVVACSECSVSMIVCNLNL